MDGDIFFLIHKNHVVLCPSGAREKAATLFIDHVLRKAGQEDLTSKFSIEPVADIDKVKLLRQEGVKKLTMKESLYEASIDYVERTTTKKKLFNAFAKEFLAFFADDDDEQLHDINEKENLTVNIEISFDSRKKGGDVGKKRIKEAAHKIIQDDDDSLFSIVTGSGKELNANEIRLSEKTNIKKHGNSVNRDDAWQKLYSYFLDLKHLGMLEQ